VLTEGQQLGARGERVAERWSISRGWTVVHRRFRSGHRDIDLVVQRGNTVAFVEVKTRRGDEYGDPVAAVDHRKQRELTRSALVWISRYGRADVEYRFDVIGILIDRQAGVARVKHIENAFWSARA
jgi:putative endonuclease